MRALLWWAPALALVGCQFVSGVTDKEVVDTTATTSSTASGGGQGGAAGGMGGTGGMGGSGGVGGAPECATAATCPGMDSDCRMRTCVSGMCGVQDEVAGTACNESGGAFCDGMGVCSNRVALWSLSAGDPEVQKVEDIAVAANGDVVIVSTLKGDMVNFGGGIVPTVQLANPEIVVTKFDSNGVHLWDRAFTAANESFGKSVAIDSNGDVVVVGYFSGTIQVGNTQLTSNGDYDVVVAKLNGTAGTLQWASSHGGTFQDRGMAVGTHGTDIWVGGYFYGTGINFGGGALVNVGQGAAFLAKLDANGDHIFSTSFSTLATDDQELHSLDVSVSGDVVFGGTFLGAGQDGFVTVVNSSGAIQYTHEVNGTGDAYGWQTAFTSNGQILLAGYLDGQNNIATLTHNAVSTDAFVARFNNTAPLWVNYYTGAGEQNAFGVDELQDGSIVVTGQFASTVDFGGGDITSAGDLDVFLLLLNAGGAHQWSQRFGGAIYEQIGTAVGTGSSNFLYLAGTHGGTIQFGPTVHTGTNSDNRPDIFLAKLTR
jgi:hypothetical protein